MKNIFLKMKHACVQVRYNDTDTRSRSQRVGPDPPPAPPPDRGTGESARASLMSRDIMAVFTSRISSLDARSKGFQTRHWKTLEPLSLFAELKAPTGALPEHSAQMSGPLKISRHLCRAHGAPTPPARDSSEAQDFFPRFSRASLPRPLRMRRTLAMILVK
jgi:hypothetical protein